MDGPGKLWNWKYILFVGIQAMNYTLFYVAYPVIPKYAVSIGFTIAQAGVLAGVLPIAALIARPIAGYCIDHLERKSIMMASLIMGGISMAVLDMTVNWILLLVLRIVYGAAFSFLTTMTVSCVTDYIPEKNMAEGIGYFGLGVALAAAIGPPVGLLIYATLGAKTLFLIMGIVNVMCAAIILFIPIVKKEHTREKQSFSVFNFIEKSVILYALLMIPFAFGTGFTNSFFALTAEARHIDGYSAFFTVFALAMMVLKPLSGKVQDRWGLASVLIPAFVLTALALGIISLAQTLTLMIIAALLLAFGQGAGQPALMAKCVSEVDYARRGIALSTYYIGLDVGIGIGNITGSRVASALGYEGAYILCAALLVAGLIIYLIHEMLKKRREHEETV